jgi:hypothetical protein
MNSFLHTPYVGSARPFTIGLKAIDPAQWIEIDDKFAAHLVEKDRLLAERHGDVFAAEPETLDAQRELASLLLEHLSTHHPDIYRFEDGTVFIAPTAQHYKLADFAERPLELAARLVQEDIVLMRPGADGHRLAAAALCFPSGWSLADKFGKPMAQVHGPVPAFGPGTKTAQLIERIFTNLKPGQMVERLNWALFENGELFYKSAAHGIKNLFDASGGLTAWLRTERQTLMKLPRSGDVVFTIKIGIDPISALRSHADRDRLAAGLAEQIAALDERQADYKKVADIRRDLLDALARMMEEIGPNRAENES